MKSSKLFAHLQILSEKERREFLDWVRSPAFNKSPEVTHWAEYWVEHVLPLTRNKPSREKGWESVFPGTPFDLNRYRKLNTRILKILKNYLAWRELSEIDLGLLALRRINRDGTPDIFQQQSRRVKKVLDQKGLQEGPQDYPGQPLWNQYLYGQEQLWFGGKTRNEEVLKNLAVTRSNLEHYLAGQKHLFSIVHKLQTGTYPEAPLISPENFTLVHRALFLLDQLGRNPDEKVWFDQLEGMLEPGKGLENTRSYDDLLTALSNHCARKVNQGNLDWLAPQFRIYKMMLNAGMMIHQDGFSPLYFRQVVRVAVQLGEILWAAEFIHEFGPQLPLKIRGAALSFSWGLVHYYQGEADLARKEFDDCIARTKNLSFNLAGRFYLLWIYFEKNDDDLFFPMLDSFRMFLQRHKEIKQDRRERYFRVLKLIRALFMVAPHDKKGLEKIGEIIEKYGGLSIQNWLREQWRKKAGK